MVSGGTRANVTVRARPRRLYTGRGDPGSRPGSWSTSSARRSTIVQALDAGTSAVSAAPRSRRRTRSASELGDAVLGGERQGVQCRASTSATRRRSSSSHGPRPSCSRRRTEPGPSSRPPRLRCSSWSGACSTSTPSRTPRASAGRTSRSSAPASRAASEDDAYCAGRIAALVGGEPTAEAEQALELAASFPTAEEAFRTIRRVGETVAEEDLVWCARESVVSAVPRFDGMRGTAARLIL